MNINKPKQEKPNFSLMGVIVWLWISFICGAGGALCVLTIKFLLKGLQ